MSEDAAERFLAALEPGAREAIDRAALARHLEAALAAARAAWPALVLDAGTLAEVWARRLELAGGLDAAFAAHTSDLALAAACLAGDEAAVRALIAGPLAGALAAVPAAEVDERRQQLLEHVVLERGLARYEGRAPLRAWLRVIAVRARLRDHERGRRIVDDDTALAERAAGADAPELAFLKHHLRARFVEALLEAIAALSIHDRVLLRQHYLDEVDLAALARQHGTHRATVARWLAKIRERLLADTQARLARAGVPAAELAETFALVSSRLEVSLRRVLTSRLT